MPMNTEEQRRLHKFCSLNRHAIAASEQVGCFGCLRIWDPKEHPIKEWTDDSPYSSAMQDAGLHGNATAICPFCMIDTVLASLSVGEITPKMLAEMAVLWLGAPPWVADDL